MHVKNVMKYKNRQLFRARPPQKSGFSATKALE